MFENFIGRRVAAAIVLVILLASTQSASTYAAGAAAEGQQVYNTYCVLCHGVNLMNTGSNAPDLRKFPKNQKPRFVKAVSKGKGQGKMPAWGDILTPEQINKIWAYVRARGKI